jgi:hypothetical protein
VQQLDETLPALLEAGWAQVVPGGPPRAATTNEPLALRLERAADATELNAARERAAACIANARGGGAAAQFASRFIRPALA